MSSLTNRISGRGAAGWAVSDLAESMIARGEDVIALTLGDPDFDTPEVITDAAIGALRNGRTHYAAICGIAPLRSSVAVAQSRLDGLPWCADNVVIFPGAQSALFSVMLCIGDVGKKVIVFDPMYATYSAVVGASGAEKVTVPIKLAFDGSTRATIDFDALEHAVEPDVVAILLNAPNNPGGFVFDNATLQRLAEICVKHDLWLISDEVYRDLTFDGRFESISALPGMAERTIIVNSLSKSHAMTGWRIGWAIAPASLVEHLGRLAQCSLFGSPTFIQDAGVVALEQCNRYVAVHRERFARRRDLLLAELSKSESLRISPPGGGMFVLVDVRRTGLSGEAFAQMALQEASVAVVPGMAFSEHEDWFVRVSFAGNESRLSEGARRLVRFADRTASRKINSSN
nr:aminotransferase class I/II-fold pyridoxal phosphate-dependent enzyme [Caballeronia sp. NCF2]